MRSLSSETRLQTTLNSHSTAEGNHPIDLSKVRISYRLEWSWGEKFGDHLWDIMLMNHLYREKLEQISSQVGDLVPCFD